MIFEQYIPSKLIFAPFGVMEPCRGLSIIMSSTMIFAHTLSDRVLHQFASTHGSRTEVSKTIFWNTFWTLNKIGFLMPVMVLDDECARILMVSAGFTDMVFTEHLLSMS